MFDIGWQEIFLVALVALVVIGPKDLPRALKTVTGIIRKLRGMAREFQSGLDDIVRESDLADMRREIEAQTGGDLRKRIEESIDPDGDISKDLDDMRSIEGDLNKAAKDFSNDVKKPLETAKADVDTVASDVKATPVETETPADTPAEPQAETIKKD